MRCKTCKYFDKNINPDVGTCCRYPPIPVRIFDEEINKEIIEQWRPDVYKNNYCGEYIPKPTEVKENG